MWGRAALSVCPLSDCAAPGDTTVRRQCGACGVVGSITVSGRLRHVARLGGARWLARPRSRFTVGRPPRGRAAPRAGGAAPRA
eukprot:5030327-Prymnesium_polylepis.1